MDGVPGPGYRRPMSHRTSVVAAIAGGVLLVGGVAGTAGASSGASPSPRAAATTKTSPTTGGPDAESSAERAVPKPTIVQKSIPITSARRAQTRAYAKRHYGKATSTIARPRVIVEHWTASATASSAFSTFASNAPDVELHERPGVCSQFLIDRGGRILQLTPIRFLCRHTVGLNDRAIGIEHVGVSDGDVLSHRRQMAASYRLTRWLKCKYDIETSDVIGHSESLSSPYHHERVARLKNQTHGDWKASSMRKYRKVIAGRGC